MQENQLLLSKIYIHFKSQELHTCTHAHEAPDTVTTCTPGQHLGAFVSSHGNHSLVRTLHDLYQGRVV